MAHNQVLYVVCAVVVCAMTGSGVTVYAAVGRIFLQLVFVHRLFLLFLQLSIGVCLVWPFNYSSWLQLARLRVSL